MIMYACSTAQWYNMSHMFLGSTTSYRNCVSAYKAIHAAIGIMKDFAENEDTLPLNVALEMRFTKHSTSPMSPAYGREVDDTLHNIAYPVISPVDPASIPGKFLAIPGHGVVYVACRLLENLP